MSGPSRSRWVFVLAAASCLPHPSDPNKFHDSPLAVPSALRGPIPVRFRNALNEPYCGFRLVPEGAPDPGGNWLPNRLSIEARSTDASGQIKPGTYIAKALDCSGRVEDSRTVKIDRMWDFEVNYDKYRGKDPDGVNQEHGWTTLWSGTPQYLQYRNGGGGAGGGQDPVQAGGNCIADGQRAEGGNCCSPSRHSMFLCNSNQTVDLCGPKQDGEGNSLPCN